MKSQRVNLRTTFRLKLVTDSVTIKAPLWQGTIAVPDVGLCEADRNLQELPELSCRAGVHSAAAARVWIEDAGDRSEPVQSGDVRGGNRLLSGLSPVTKWAIDLKDPGTPAGEIQALMDAPGAQLAFAVQRPLADLTRELSLANVDLRPYLGPQ